MNERKFVTLIGDVRCHLLNPAPVRLVKTQVAPPHPPHVDEEREIEPAEDGVKTPHRGRAAQNRRHPEEIRSMQGQAAQHQVDASDRNYEMNGTLVKCIATDGLRI